MSCSTIMETTCRNRTLLTAKIVHQNENNKIQNQEKYSNDILVAFLMPKFNSEASFFLSTFQGDSKNLNFQSHARSPYSNFSTRIQTSLSQPYKAI